MDKKEYLEKKNKPPKYPNGYAGPVCGKCGNGMIGSQSVNLDDETERRIKIKYGHLCDNCKNILP